MKGNKNKAKNKCVNDKFKEHASLTKQNQHQQVLN